MKRCAERTFAAAAMAVVVLGGAAIPAVAESGTPDPHAGHGGHVATPTAKPAPTATPAPAATPAPTSRPSTTATSAPTAMDHENMPGMDHGDHGTGHDATPGPAASRGADSTPGTSHGEHSSGPDAGPGAAAQEPATRAPVLMSFAAINLTVMAAAWVLRRQSADQRRRRRLARRTAANRD